MSFLEISVRENVQVCYFWFSYSFPPLGETERVNIVVFWCKTLWYFKTSWFIYHLITYCVPGTVLEIWEWNHQVKHINSFPGGVHIVRQLLFPYTMAVTTSWLHIFLLFFFNTLTVVVQTSESTISEVYINQFVCYI